MWEKYKHKSQVNLFSLSLSYTHTHKSKHKMEDSFLNCNTTSFKKKKRLSDNMQIMTNTKIL